MKHAIFLLITIGAFSCSPWKKVATSPAYSQIVDAPGLSKDELFVGINRWIAYEFATSESVINYADKEAGVISGRYISDYEAGGYVNSGKSDIVFEIRDDRFKISFEARETRSKGLKGLHAVSGPLDWGPWTPIKWQHDLDAIMSQYDEVIDRVVGFLNEIDENW